MFMGFFFFKKKTAYGMRISDWSSDVCSSRLGPGVARCLRSLGATCCRNPPVTRAGRPVVMPQRPVPGRQPANVYRVRRAIADTNAVVVLFLLWQLVSSFTGGGDEDTAPTAATTTTTTPPQPHARA